MDEYLSQWMDIELFHLKPNPISKFNNHITSHTVCIITRYTIAAEDQGTTSYFLLLYLTKIPPTNEDIKC